MWAARRRGARSSRRPVGRRVARSAPPADRPPRHRHRARVADHGVIMRAGGDVGQARAFSAPRCRNRGSRRQGLPGGSARSGTSARWSMSRPASRIVRATRSSDRCRLVKVMVRPSRSNVSLVRRSSKYESRISKTASSSRVGNRPAELIGWTIAARVPAGDEDAGDLPDGCVDVVDVLEGHEGCDQVGAGVRQREGGGIADLVASFGIRFPCRGHERRRAIHADDVVAQTLQVPVEPALAATDVDDPARRWRQRLQELVAMELPVAVVARRSCPRDPVPGLILPGVAERHLVGYVGRWTQGARHSGASNGAAQYTVSR